MIKKTLIDLLITIKLKYLLSKQSETSVAVSLSGKRRQVSILLLNLLHLDPGKE